MSAAIIVLAVAVALHPGSASARIGTRSTVLVSKEFLLMIAVVFLVVTVLMAVGTIALALAGAMAAATVIITMRQHMRRRRIIVDTKSLGAYIGQLAADIDSGAHHFHAVETAAAQLPEDASPASTHGGRICSRASQIWPQSGTCFRPAQFF